MKVLLAAGVWGIILGSTGAACLAEGVQGMPSARQIVQDDTVRIAPFDLPVSGYLKEETRSVLKRQAAEFAEMLRACPARVAGEADAVLMRQCLETYYYRKVIARQRARYKVAITPAKLGGVAAEVITPQAGIAQGNLPRVLINLHGGNFIWGGRWGGEVESIPIAAVGRIKVVSVDYRMAPEYRFPAASEDVASVYRALLRDYKPENIGIYGCSAGALLTAEAVAWFRKVGLPMPGAVGLFCGGAFMFGGGDSSHIAAAIAGPDAKPAVTVAYFSDLDSRNPLAVPGLDPKLMASFPHSLLLSSTRDLALSSVVATQSELTRLGVATDLHVWEGLGHGFFFESDLPESREAYDVIARFFNAHLGGARAANGASETH